MWPAVSSRYFCYYAPMSLLETVKKLAGLSRIGLKPGEDEELAKDIESILAYVSEVQSVTGNEVVSHAGPLRNVMREDGPAAPSGVNTEKLLASVPHREGQYVKVKKILNT